MSICSFYDDGSIEADAGSPAAAQLLKHDERMPLVDAYAFVDDAKAARKASRSKKDSSASKKQKQAVPSSTAAVVTVAAPSKPLKWQVSCKDVAALSRLQKALHKVAFTTYRCCLRSVPQRFYSCTVSGCLSLKWCACHRCHCWNLNLTRNAEVEQLHEVQRFRASSITLTPSCSCCCLADATCRHTRSFGLQTGQLQQSSWRHTTR
jgi:hypothetical protein